MKSITCFYLIALLPAFCFADAGINIKRDKAPCYAVFTGIDKLSAFEFYKIPYGGSNQDFADSSNQLKNNDKLTLDYPGYSRRNRGEVGAIKILIRSKITQQFIDSFSVVAEGYNLNINFAAAENNKVIYTIEKSRAEYPYQLFSGEDTDTASVAKRNRLILISLSVIGFFTLAFMFYKRRNSNTPLKDS